MRDMFPFLHDVPVNPRKVPGIVHGGGRFCQWAAIISSLRREYAFWRGAPLYACLIVPTSFDIGFVEAALEAIGKQLPADKQSKYLHRASVFECCSKGSRSKSPWQGDTSRWIFALAHHEGDIPRAFRLAADATIIVRDILPRDVSASVRYFSRQTLALDDAVRASTLPLQELDVAIRRDRPVERIVEALRRLSAHPEHAALQEGRPRATLDEIPGYGAAAAWGLQLSMDLAAWRRGALPWSQVDRGVLLAGPPGTGKTTFARALAATCGVPLIASSASQWQAKGHLGDMLGAMWRTFSQARDSAPCILLIDEIEAVGDRANVDRDSYDYLARVIAGLLECMDGANSREGVVIVAATNYPDRIDAALCRPGRLDRRIDILLPSLEDRAKILAFHGADLAGDDLLKIAARTPGRSGAALEQIVRSARRRARIEERAVSLSDFEAELPPLFRVPDEVRRRIAVHEAGHVVVALALGFDEVIDVQISFHIDPGFADDSVGGTRMRRAPSLPRTRQEYLDEITALLAGAAAEQVVFGARTDGAGGREGSDLQRATALAATMIGSVGLDETLGYVAPSQSDDLVKLAQLTPALGQRVEAVLGEQFSRAARILSENSMKLTLIADDLFRRGKLSRAEVAEICNRRQSSE